MFIKLKPLCRWNKHVIVSSTSLIGRYCANHFLSSGRSQLLVYEQTSYVIITLVICTNLTDKLQE